MYNHTTTYVYLVSLTQLVRKLLKLRRPERKDANVRVSSNCIRTVQSKTCVEISRTRLSSYVYNVPVCRPIQLVVSLSANIETIIIERYRSIAYSYNSNLNLIIRHQATPPSVQYAHTYHTYCLRTYLSSTLALRVRIHT